MWIRSVGHAGFIAFWLLSPSNQALACSGDFPKAGELRRDSIEVFAGDVIDVGTPDDEQFASITIDVVERWKGDYDTTEVLSWYVGPDEFDCGLTLPIVGERYLLYERVEGQADEPIVAFSAPTADWLVCPLGRGRSPSGWHAVDEAEFVRDEDCGGCNHTPGSVALALSLAAFAISLLRVHR